MSGLRRGSSDARAAAGTWVQAGTATPGGTTAVVAAAIAAGVCLFVSPAALAGGDETNRITALEGENALMRKEIDDLRKSLTTGERTISCARSARSTERKQMPASLAPQTNRKSDPFGAYAADLPATYKAVPMTEARGELRLWGEGGATWTGGDPSLLFYPSTNLSFVSSGLGPIPGSQYFDLKPKLGWEGAGGFDYRFANSPWHVSGQFRYGEGTAKGSFAASRSADPTLLGNNNIAAVNLGQAIDADGKETHWLADLAIGRDVLGNGPDAMQVKAGLRISEFRASTSSRETDAAFEAFNRAVVISGITTSSLSATTTTNLTQEARFLGAGPRIGVEGSVPFAGKWSFDYLGDAAVLFGTQRYSQVQNGSTVVVPTILGASPLTLFPSLDERFATVFNGDLQFGFSYWFTPNVKMSASYRLDAYLNVLTGLSPTNDVSKLQTVDRFIHGPRLGITAQF